MMTTVAQYDQTMDLLWVKGIARLSEVSDAGITAVTIGRMVRVGEANRLAPGTLRLPDPPLDGNHSLVEAAKHTLSGHVCLVSAPPHHEQTEQLLRGDWMAIGTGD